ncbi:LysE family translocator [Serratia marcescens]|nr:LysE family translocator [Serratia marcescens]
MTIETWLAFTGTSALLLLIPGPTTLLVISYALGRGWRSALPVVFGVALGDFTAMTLSMLGIGALLLASAIIFNIFKLIGAAYLIYLGISLFRSGETLRAKSRSEATSSVKMLGHAWLVTALNPKSIAFFVAFLPQFMDNNERFLPQMMVFETTFLALAFGNALGYAIIASRAGKAFGSPRAIGLFHKAGGTLLIGAGIATAVVKSTH